MENGSRSFVAPAPKYKRRKVFAIRDFPPGCGRNAQQLNLRSARETEAPITANAHEDYCKEGSSDGPENGASGMLEDLHEVVAATLNDEYIPILLDQKFLSPSNGMFFAVSNGNGLEKPVARKFPPRRRVSAVRDFPPNCGRNAASLRKEESPEELASSENKSLDLEKSESRLNGTVKIDVQGATENVGDGDSGKGLVVAIQPKESESKANGKALTEPVKSDDVQDEDQYRSQLEKSVSKVTRGIVQPKESMELLASTGNKTLGQQPSSSGVDEKLLKGTVMTDVKRTIVDTQPKDSQAMFVSSTNSSGRGKSRKVMDVETSMGIKSDDLKQPVGSSLGGDSRCEKIGGGDESETKVEQRERQKQNEPPFEDKLFWWDHEFETVVGKDDDDEEGSDEHMDEDVVAYPEENTVNEKHSDTFGNDNQFQAVDIVSLGLPSDRVVVQGLMAASCCPWRQGKVVGKLKPPAGTSGSKGKKLDRMSPLEGKKTKMTARKKIDENSTNLKMFSGEDASQGAGQLVIWDKDKSLQRNENENRKVGSVSRAPSVIVPPLNPSILRGEHKDNDAVVMRHKVREALRLYQAVCRKLLQEEENKSKEGKQGIRRIDLRAANILKEKGKFVNQGKQIFGPVPGVEVGDEFQYRIELNVIGLHRQIQGGIDYSKRDGKILATSIVASGGYSDDLDNSDVLIYTGQGGNVMNAGKEPEDQRLERGNLALKNSLDDKNPVRVIRGCESSEGKSEGKAKTYIYDGLYLVEKFWQDLGSHGKLVFKFQLERIPGQPELAWKEVKKSKKYKVREGVCVEDISQGKEVIPICAVNTIDDEKPPPFKYTTSLIYPDWYHHTTPWGCNCTTKCSDSAKCSCAVRNGGEIPYNYNGAIVEVKPLVFECGPSCRCSSSCHNRVSQHGIKFQLGIFKTEKRGWGVRSLNFIPSGSFICEYIGELLKEKEAEERTGNDEYLFDIGNNYNDNTLWDGLEALIPDLQHASPEVVEDSCFTIDAAEYGNVGRFINHSCTPNLYAQNVLFDHDDKRIPHIMLFAAENIPALQELTYHYNYTIDQVREPNGTIKKKSCFCGSPECTGRLY